jgi:hypothetical protein
MDSMRISQADVFFSNALELLLEEGHLKVHNVDREDLEKIAQTLKWVKQFSARAQTAWSTPSTPAPEPVLLASPKSKSKKEK